MDLVKKSWKTDKVTGTSDFCLPLNDQADNLRVNISKEGKNFEMTTHQTLIKHWDGLKDGKLHGGVKNVDSVMIQIYVPDWFKGSKISITDIHTQELIVSGGM